MPGVSVEPLCAHGAGRQRDLEGLQHPRGLAAGRSERAEGAGLAAERLAPSLAPDPGRRLVRRRGPRACRRCAPLLVGERHPYLRRPGAGRRLQPHVLGPARRGLGLRQPPRADRVGVPDRARDGGRSAYGLFQHHLGGRHALRQDVPRRDPYAHAHPGEIPAGRRVGRRRRREPQGRCPRGHPRGLSHRAAPGLRRARRRCAGAPRRLARQEPEQAMERARRTQLCP
mmetsp:Transcript_69196/g.200418  ORF Transcript_69196/g.200418 Transcript_69196/m.200418 type:complete len:228 (+) Transcript_69196:748-1431(+)